MLILGYDDSRGDYIMISHAHIAYRYEILSLLGKGSFGQVVKVYDHCTNKIVALKVIRNKKRFHQQAIVEVKVLEHLKNQVTPPAVHVKPILISYIIDICR